jgi:hypothetical protein
VNDTAKATPPASPKGAARPSEIRLTSDPEFWMAIEAAQAFHLVKSKRLWTVEELVGPALQGLRPKTGSFAAKMLANIDFSHAARMKVITLDAATIALADSVAEHLLATNARRETVRQSRQRHFWNSTRPVILVALYTYGLGCRGQLISVYGKASAVEDILNGTLS